MILLLEMHKDIGGEGNGEGKESRGERQVGHPCSPLPSQLKFLLIDICLTGLSNLSKEREAAALFHPGHSLDDIVPALELSELPGQRLGEG